MSACNFEITPTLIGVGDVPPTKKSGKYFSPNYDVKFGNFVNFYTFGQTMYCPSPPTVD